MASDSPGNYSKLHQEDSHDCHVFGALIHDTNGTRGNFQLSVVGGFQKEASFAMKDSGYYVSTSDGASTCSSSTTEAGEGEGGTLLVLEPKSLRSFTTNDEYLYAMKEDLADWFSCLYQRDDITADRFFQALETGVLLCKHANKVQEFARQRREMGESLEMKSYFIRSVPEGNVSYREGVKPETFQARDNVSNFIAWGRQLGIPEVLSFETDDLVLRKNEKSVTLCLLEIARVGAKLGMLAPTLIQMEQEIDAELAGEEPTKPQIQIITCDMRSLDERVRDLIGRCICPIQFPMIKVGEGKYKIGDTRSLIFVRILRNHVMVRVGGGWDTLENYLNKHDPCQCNYRGHRPTVGAAHKVVVSQQRQPVVTQSNPAVRTTPNTPTSPRRGSTAAAAVNHRSSSPQSSSSSSGKTPTLLISRHLPATHKRATSPENPPKGKQVPPNQSHQGVATETSSNPTSILSCLTVGKNSTSSARGRSTSPRTKTSGVPHPKSSDWISPGVPQSKRKDLGPCDSSLTSRQDVMETVDSDNEGEENTSNDGYFAEDEDSNNPCLQEHARSGSFDDGACLHSLSSSLGQRRESDTTVNTTTNSITRTNVNIDKVSTMTLSEFKSLLNSALSIPEEQKQEHVHQSDGRIPEQSQGKAFSSTRSSNLTSQKEKNSSVRDSSDICARQVTNTDSSGLGRTVGIKSKITKSISISKAQMDSGDTERNVPKEEYQMARPKPPSQIKREAVAKVAGAISHLVEARNEVESTSTVSSRPKTPTRPKTLLGPHTQNMLPENDEENNFDISGTGANSLMQALAIAARERPVTPSRIPKPCLTPRSKTPISFAPDSPSDVPSHLCFPPQQGINSSLSRINITSVSRPAALSRSNSNSSSVKSVDDAPVSPASSFSEDRVFKIHTRTRRLSNSSDSFNTNNTANSSINNAGRSYKDIYTAKRAASSGSECRIPPTRAVTPGPREKWTLGNNGGSGGGSFSEMTSSASNNHRRGSINTTCQSDKQILHKSVMPPIYRTSSTSNIETEQPMTITNEITFSDDEEINELIKSAAIKVGAHSVRSSSVDARKLVQQNAKENEVLIIRRDPHMKGGISNNVHYSVARRPASRGSSVDRASPATVASRLSQASSSSIHGQKIMQAGKKQEDDTSRSENKDLNRTEAWVDSTLPDNKQKPLPRPKRSKRIENEIKTNELASMPLEEIKAILAEPKNGFVQVDARILEPPAEDPEMFEKMERLFEKYREMELKASAKEMPGKGNGRLAPRNKLSDTQSAKGGNKGSSQRASRPSIPAASLKTSCSSFLSSSGYSSDQITGDSSSGKILSVGDKTSVRSSVTPGPFHNKLHISSNNSPALALSSHGAQHYFSSDTTNQTEILSQNLKTSGSGNEHKGLSVLQDLDPEVAKNPAALISKIQEILKVRPRKDENTKGSTRIPAPAILSKSNKSKSVSNLLSDCVFSTNSGSSHDFNEELPDGKILPHNLNSDFIYNDNMNSVDSFRKSSALSSGNNDYSELDKDDDGADEVPDLTHTWSVKSDSSDSQNRSETPVPKLATPLTTGRSTLISRKSDRLGRSLSQDKENMSNSQSTISNRSILSAREDEVEFV